MARTKWLSKNEQRAWRSYMEATMLVLDALDRQLQQDSDMPLGYYELLVRLSEAQHHTLRMSELAEASRSSRSRLSHAASRLEERGWIERQDCPTDRRGQLARLTPRGEQALADAAPGHVAAVRRHIIGRLTPDQVRQLEEVARAIVEGLTTPQTSLRDLRRSESGGAAPQGGCGGDESARDEAGEHQQIPSERAVHRRRRSNML